jgi:hypothetical protein
LIFTLTRPLVLPAPSASGLNTQALAPKLTAKAEPVRTLALEWSWQPFNAVGGISGADGYSTWLSNTDIAGPYSRVSNQAASTAGTQKYSKDYAEARVGDMVFGTIKAVTNNRTTESGYSNADRATYPRALDGGSPIDGATLSDGRPVLTWTPVEGAAGYLYFVYDKNPWEAGASVLWSNTPNATTDLSAVFPSDPAVRVPLKAGTYYWWVAAVTPDAFRKADAFSFSDPRKFIVP